LAAAHETGLVHRDFKPDNVMIGEDGRVRVMDFGLASEALEIAADQAEAPTLSDSTRSIRLTRTGALLGTPAYMAPEQIDGKAVDARSDQFSFAVAFYEALHGCRPFAGDTARELREAIRVGARRRTERSPSVPGWLDRIVTRALSADPDARFPSMTELLAALDDDPAGRRPWLLGAGLVGVALAGGLLAANAWLGGAAAVEAPCRGLEEGLVGAWDPTRRAAGQRAFAATEASYAEATWARVEAALDDYTRAWVAARVDACEASRDGVQSDALLDLRIACLNHHLAVVRALVDELAEADEELLSRALQGVDALPRLDVCADADALTAAVPPPADPARAARAEALTRQLGVIEARFHLGRYDEAVAELDASVAAIRELDYAPLEIRARLWRGRLQHDMGAFDDAAGTFTAAYYDALGQRMFDEATDAAARVVTTQMWIGDPESAAPWIALAQATAAAARSGWAEATYLHANGLLARSRGDWSEARRAFERSIALMERIKGAEDLSTNTLRVELAAIAHAEGRVAEADALHEHAMAAFERILGPDSRMLSTAINDMGAAAYLRGDYRQARELFERALAIDTRTLGPAHPELSSALSNLGAIAKLEGDGAAARAYLDKALVLLERSVGRESIELAPILINLGSAEAMAEDYAQARVHYGRAVALRERFMGPDHPEVAEALHYLGTVASQEGELDEAEAAYRRARAIFEASPIPAEHKALSLGDSWTDLLIRQGRLAEAEVEAESILAARERTQGPDHPASSGALLNLGRARLGLGQPDDAIAPLTRAAALLEASTSPARSAPARFALARALWDASIAGGRDRDRARELATAARDDLGAQAGARGLLREIDAWRATHSGG
ncbi:MAG: serine/threonine-protein kinase, partial [Nannocystaceae bacterium]